VFVRAKPCAAVCAARFEPSGGGHPNAALASRRNRSSACRSWATSQRFGIKSLLPYLPGVGGGLLLALLALGYQAVLSHIPFTADILRKTHGLHLDQWHGLRALRNYVTTSHSQPAALPDAAMIEANEILSPRHHLRHSRTPPP
jgi:hypothetical protein